mmetsp:Transcript_107823/g.305015  ORF Transcript_107823/g.305015 Transcript_107823/m.305015 type:complete len:253 (+) Transcript_107823:223-981(+)
MVNRAGTLRTLEFMMKGAVIAKIQRNRAMMLWYGKGKGVSATFAAWLKPRLPSEMTWTIRLRMGAAVLHMSPAGSYFCRARSRLMIQDSTMATRAEEGTGCPSRSDSSALLSAVEMPPRTVSWRLKPTFGCERYLRSSVVDEESEGTLVFPCTGQVTGAATSFERSPSQRRCCSANACIRLKRWTTSPKNSSCSGPVVANSLFSVQGTYGTEGTEDCRNGRETSPLASNTMAMQAPSSHLAPMRWTASRASQ